MVICYNVTMVFSSSIQKENTMSITRTKNGTYRLRVYILRKLNLSRIDKKVIENGSKQGLKQKNTN